ncbi:MAG: hypothetical protein VX612_03575, partial [Pseudomonadota bacterium]|nr:hypothetical protein [Pseudomonadota bacterium]
MDVVFGGGARREPGQMGVLIAETIKRLFADPGRDRRERAGGDINPDFAMVAGRELAQFDEQGT